MNRTCLTVAMAVVLSTFCLPPGLLAAEEPKSPLHEEMEAMGGAFKKLTGQIVSTPAPNAEQKGAMLDLVATMLKHAEGAKALMPSKAGKLAGDDKTKYLETFAKDMAALVKELGVLKEAIAAGNAEGMKAELKTIVQLKGMSHKELGVESHKHGAHGPPKS
jgi:Cytochrome b562